MSEKALYIIKKDKYSLSIIKNNIYNSNKKSGISIFKKTLELNELNEDNINMILLNTDKEELIYSSVNIGFISIVGLLSFAYCREEDLRKIGEINQVSLYQITNIRYIVLNSDEEDNNNQFLKEFTDYEVSKGLIFTEDPIMLDLSFDNYLFNNLYNVEQNICHLSPDINFCYNDEIMAYFRKYNLVDFVTHLIGGFYYSVNVDFFTIHFLVKELDLRNKVERAKIKLNQKEIKEIEIFITSDEQTFHFDFYCLIDTYLNLLKDNKLIYNLLKKNQPNYKKDNGAFLIIDIKNKCKGNNDKQIKEMIIDIRNHLNSELGFKNNYLYLKGEDKISDFIEKNSRKLDEVIYNYEYKKLDLLQLQTSPFLIITDNEANSLDFIENIILNLKYKYLTELGELNKKKIVSSLKEMTNKYRQYIVLKNKKLSKKSMIYSEPVNNDFLNKYITKSTKYIKVNRKANLKKSTNNINNNNNDNINDNININKIIQNKENNNFKKKIEGQNTISVYIVTNNVNCYQLDDLDSELNLKKLIYPDILKERLSENNLPTFYCIGLQEIVKLNTSNVLFSNNKNLVDYWEKQITQLLQKDNYNYSLQYRDNIVGVLFLFFVKTSEAKYITDIKRCAKKSGLFNALGNKGYIIYEFKYKNRSFAFCTGHLTAGEKDNNSQDRIDQLTDILGYQTDKNSKRICENDFYFLFGDMNFRVRVDKQEFYDQINKLTLDYRKSNSNDIKKNIILSDEMFSPKAFNLKTPKNKKKNNNKKMNLTFNKTNEDESYDNIEMLMDKKINESQFRNYFLTKHIQNEELTMLKDKLWMYKINEHEINFLPSYKYIKGYNYYNISKRIPSWTDRILFKDSKQIECLCYDKIDVRYSDHRPVYALFEINL